MKRNTKKRAIFTLANLAMVFTLNAILLFTSCQKDDIINTKAPIISGIELTDREIKTTETLSFTPEVSSEVEVTYSWVVNEKEISISKDFVFDPESTGRYLIVFSAANNAGVATKSINITVRNYIGGYFIVNEGWFGTENGSVNYVDVKDYSFIRNVYSDNNLVEKSSENRLTLGTTTCYSAIWDGNLYFISKQGRRIVVADALSLKDKGEILEIAHGCDGRAFAGINKTTGVVTTSDGAYLLNLNPLSVGAQLIGSGDGNQCGDIYVSDKHIFIMSSNKGILIYDKTSYDHVKTYDKGEIGFTLSKDGFLWAGDKKSLIKIDVNTLDIEEVTLPENITINGSWGAWAASHLVASTTENHLYFGKKSSWGQGNEIYRYIIGDISSLNSYYIKPENSSYSFYGSSIAVDPSNGDLIALFNEGWGDAAKRNRIITYDTKTGSIKKDMSYEEVEDLNHFWFPSMIVFNK